jgi:hypothetical protein
MNGRPHRTRRGKSGFADGLDLHVATDTWDLETVRSFTETERPLAPLAMSEPLALSLGQKFELERMNRAIDATADPQALRGLAKQLLQAWHSQKAATQWVMRQQLGGPPRVPAELGLDTIGFEGLRPGPEDLEAEEG